MPAPGTPDDLVAQIAHLRRYARALTGDRWAADDLVQDTLERACRRWRLWAVGSDLRAWLFSVMHNLFVDGIRRARRHSSETPADDFALEQAPAPSAPIDRALDLQACLMRLPEEQREVLLLVTLQDLGYADVARITGVPVGTVMSRLSRARSRLRELMEEEDQPGALPRRPGLRRMK
ncbi:sigma-70 family RNA polymerase sigma factor [Ramlibacter sp. AW1]|uniref:Sigma-70 family RNA polymerase sigma factor n=1 Tax=Ramlibacter aurantiacus TaxID=2801330 RepID=A0A936ZK62_9BURK|nr:sigma-70 family RNA polymerase sigma factor [Ramlibacter aurantiacus]MBL0418773.1 sigma-70 family RNA polymerase sigma factor [Ramlibacter aurantiacus]